MIYAVLAAVTFYGANFALRLRLFLKSAESGDIQSDSSLSTSALLGIAEETLYWVLFEVILGFGIAAILAITFQVAFLPHVTAIVLIAWFGLRRLLATKYSRLLPTDDSPIAPVNVRLPALMILLVTVLLDLKAHFHYALFLTICCLTAIVVLVAFYNCVAYARRGLLARKEKNAALVTVLVVCVISVISYMNFTLQGSYGFMLIEGDPLLPSYRSEVNSDGFRGPELINRRAKGLYRIALMGDSTTYGFNIEESQAYGRILEGLLNERDDGATYEVINAGVVGFNLQQTLDRLRRKVLILHPDVAMLLTGPNDYRIPEEVDYPGLVSDFVTEVRTGGGRPVLAAYACEECKPYNSMIKEVAEASRVPFVDFYTLLHVDNDETQTKWDEHHPSLLGNQLMAEHLYRFLKDEGLLPASHRKSRRSQPAGRERVQDRQPASKRP